MGGIGGGPAGAGGGPPPDMRRVPRDPSTQAAQLAPEAGGLGLQQAAMYAAELPRMMAAQQNPTAISLPDWMAQSSGGAMPQDIYNQIVAMGNLSRSIPRGRR